MSSSQPYIDSDDILLIRIRRSAADRFRSTVHVNEDTTWNEDLQALLMATEALGRHADWFREGTGELAKKRPVNGR